MSEERNAKVPLVGGLILGALVGAGAVWLFGTKSGKKAQKYLKEKGEDMMDDLEDKMDDLKKQGKQLAKEGERFKEKIMDEIGDRTENLSDDMKDKLEGTLKGIEQMQEKGLESTTSLRKKLFRNVPKR